MDSALTTETPTPCKPAGDRVAASAELAAGVQHREHDLDGRTLLDGVHVDRDAAAVVDDGDRAVCAQGDRDVVGVAGHRLVDGVVDDLVDQVVQTPLAGGADVHARALANRVEALEDLDVSGVVGQRWTPIKGHSVPSVFCAAERPKVMVRRGGADGGCRSVATR